MPLCESPEGYSLFYVCVYVCAYIHMYICMYTGEQKYTLVL